MTKDDLRIIARGLLPEGLRQEMLTSRGRDEIRGALNVVLKLMTELEVRDGISGSNDTKVSRKDGKRVRGQEKEADPLASGE